MVDGEALVMTMAMISPESPSRQGARTGTSFSRTRVSGGGGAVYHIWENPSGVLSFGDEVTYVPKESPGCGPRPRGDPQVRPGGRPRLEPPEA